MRKSYGKSKQQVLEAEGPVRAVGIFKQNKESQWCLSTENRGGVQDDADHLFYIYAEDFAFYSNRDH